METKTFLALFCTIFVYLIGEYESAPAAGSGVKVMPPTMTIVTQKPVMIAETGRNTGGHGPWYTKIDPKSKKAFNEYKKVISKKLQEVHKVSPKFVPKPDKVAFQAVIGEIYHFLIKLPIKKYAYVILSVPGGKGVQRGAEKHVTMMPKLYALNDKNV